MSSDSDKDERPSRDQDQMPGDAARRLDSWKGIASYLSRDVRTVQRWEKEEGLPVHRLLHGKQGSVYAMSVELDAWWESRRARIGLATMDALPGPEPQNRWWQWRYVLLVVSGVSALSLLLIPLAMRRTSSAGEAGLGPASVVRVAIAPPQGTMRLDTLSPPAVSPDGRFAAFPAPGPGGRVKLWLRALNRAEIHELPGTDGGRFPFWSPDSTSIGFFANGQLQVVSVTGGPPRRVADAPTGRGGSWNRNGRILFAPTEAGGLSLVSEAGGEVATVTSVTQPGSDGHHYPWFLPDGDRFLYTLLSWAGPHPEYTGVYVSSLSHAEPSRRLLEDRTNAVFASGFLLFTRRNALMAQRFDVGLLELTGEAQTVADSVERSFWDFGVFAASQAGHLTYRAQARSFDIGWIDSSGQFEPLGVPRLPVNQLRLSPDGRAALAVVPNQDGRNDIWRVDLPSGQRTRLTFGGGNWFPAWSPDSQRVLYSSYGTGYPQLTMIAATGGQPDAVVATPAEDQIASDWSRDGRYLVYSRGGYDANGVAGPAYVSLYDLEERRSHDIVPGGMGGVLSPDGQWLAHHSDESGTLQVYVQALSGSPRWQISASDGRDPVWHRNGRRIAFLQGQVRIMSTSFSPDTGVATGAEEVLFEHPGLRAFSVASDFSRALVAVEPDAGRAPLILVVNWTAELDSGSK